MGRFRFRVVTGEYGEPVLDMEPNMTRTLDEIARANGYVKVQPGQVVVDVILLQRVIEHLGSCYERKCDHLLALDLAGDLSEAMAMGKTKGGAK